MNILLANPRGFCAGVDRAISIVERALELLGPPIYVRHEVVHNRHVVEALQKKGAFFVERVEDVPCGATLIFSAHGVSQAIQEAAKKRNLTVFDATCPLVTKVHMEVARHAKKGRECILIGHAGHPEVEGTLGQYHNLSGGIYLVERLADLYTLEVKNPLNIAYVTQTTLSIEDTTQMISALRQRFPNIEGPAREDICYATQNRQDAVKRLAEVSDVVIVIGSVTSSNSNRLREIAEKKEIPAYLVDDENHLRREWFQDKKTVGITAGASAPAILVQRVVERLFTWGASGVEECSGQKETIVFSLPKSLRVS
ncbi:MAG: 4-hydroxy-3-methylbut-2-enyl diphosphate reductase [Gammaproteobacteria bacterium]|nr:4-hydroxy-3-methylbut-2-enyl diphosphate reductase [Gammaproteobacteria bacterium]